MIFKTIKKFGESEVDEKKSKFLGKVFYVQNIEEAERIIENIRKEYKEARHNCYAYRILEGKNTLERQSDDGEPSRNSGKSYAWDSAKKRTC